MSERTAEGADPSNDRPLLSFGIELEVLHLFHKNAEIRGALTKASTTEAYPVAFLLLKDSGLPLKSKTAPKKDDDLSKWQIVKDSSLIPMRPEDIGAALTKRCTLLPDITFVDGSDAEKWSNRPMEMVSPKYESISGALKDLQRLTNHLESSESFLTHDRFCGLHVHVGLADDTAFPLKVVQCLAFATIMYEVETDKLHPKHRNNGLHSESNRSMFVIDKSEGASVQYIEGFPWNLAKVKTVRKRIFDCTTLTQLQDLIGQNRQYMYNFSHIAEHMEPLRTIEFRQHDASVDPQEIMHWVVFCRALVVWAYKLAAEAEPLKHLTAWDQKDLAITKLLENLDLPKETQDYYLEKVAILEKLKKEGLN